ncbi:unnamed protein product [Brassica oleracea]
MKTVRADEFTSRHSEDSIRTMAARSDEQMSILLSTIDQIDEIRRVLKLELFGCGETITKNQETPLKWFLLIKKGQEFMLQLVNNSSKNSMTSYAREMRLSSSCSKCMMLLVNTVQRHIRTKLVSFKQHLLEKLMIFQVQFPKSISWTSLIFLVEILIKAVWLANVVGQIVNFGSLENKIIKGKDNMRLLIELRDPNNVKMICTLWGCYAKQVYDYSRSNMSTMIICVIRFCSVKEWKGSYSISSGYNSTHILLNPTLEFIEEFKARFKLIAHVKDDSGETNFLLFDANAQQIVRHSAAELYDENEDEDFLPEAVSDLFGKRVLFEISVDADNIKGKSSQYVFDWLLMTVKWLRNLLICLLNRNSFVQKKKRQDEHSFLEDQHFVNKKLSQKKLKGE